MKLSFQKNSQDGYSFKKYSKCCRKSTLILYFGKKVENNLFCHSVDEYRNKVLRKYTYLHMKVKQK